jgi:CHASE3 domain sensor protein
MRPALQFNLPALNLREFGISALFASVVLFVAAMVMLNQNVGQLRQSIAVADLAHRIQKRIDDINNLTNNVEMTVRGYALTGDARFLTRHQKTHDALLDAVNDLDELTMSEPALRPAFIGLHNAVDLHENLYGSLIGHGPGEQAVVVEAITNPAKRRFREMITANLTALERTEAGIAAAHHAAAEREVRQTNLTAFAVAAFAFLCGVCGFSLTLFGKRQAAAGAKP